MFPISLMIAGIADLITKYLASALLAQNTYRLIGDLLSLRLVQNTGVAFSIPIRGIILKVLTIAIIGFLFGYYLKHEKPRKDRLIDIGYGLVLGGALGNAYERLFIGTVTDFIRVKYFAIFNFGDIFITFGAIILLTSYLLKDGIGIKR